MARIPFSYTQRAAPPASKAPALTFTGFKKATAGVDAMLGLPSKTASAPQDAALGALMGVLFGRIMHSIPGVSQLVDGGMSRDAILGALAATAARQLNASDPAVAATILGPRLPTAPDAPRSALI